ncbi:MAG: hypothetical protein ACOCZ9_00680 [Spirochaetota bacterium]
MPAYYYTIAALPSLFYDGDPPIEKDELLSFLEGQLTDRDYRKVRSASLEEPGVFSVMTRARAADSNTDKEHEPGGESSGSEAPVSNEPGAEESLALLSFRAFDRSLRNALLRARTDDLEKVNRYAREGDVSFGGGVEEIIREAQSLNPLEAELLLDRTRFDFLAQLDIASIFDVENIVVFYLQLQLVLRRAGLTEEAGRAAFEASYQSVLEEMNNTQTNMS